MYIIRPCSILPKWQHKTHLNMKRNMRRNITTLTLANFYFKKLFYFSKGNRVYYRVFWSVWMQTPSFQTICSLIILCTPAQMQIKFTGRVQIIEFIFIVSVLPWQLNCSTVWWKYKSVEHMLWDSQATWQKAGCFLSNVMNQKSVKHRSCASKGPKMSHNKK